MNSRWVRLASAVLVPVLLLVALWFGWLSWLVADGGPVRKTLEALSWLAAIAAVGFSLVELRRRKPEVPQSVHVGRALHLDGDKLPRVADVSLLALRVKRAVGTSDGQAPPQYVPRDRDEDLEWAMASGGLVVLHGRAAAGKSRMAAEAVRRLRPGHDLLVPIDGRALRQVVEAGLKDTVIWLDDLERFLVPGGLDVGLLQRLDLSVCVVATIRDHELATLRTEGAINKAAAELIASIPPSHLIAIKQHLTEAEQEQARLLQAGDPRIGRALEAAEGFAEYLAAGPPMLERWSVGDSPLFHVGQALISAAVDCRRAGYARPVPSATLAALHRHYLPTPWRDRSDLPPVAEGLEWAARPVLGASSCLQPRVGDGYLASDYLIDRAQEGAGPLGASPIPDHLWDTLFSLSSDQDVVSIGIGAYEASRFEFAERCFRRADAAGDERAIGWVAVAIGRMGRFSEVKDIFRNAAGSGNRDVMIPAVAALAFEGRFDDISDLVRHAITTGNQDAVLLATIMLSSNGRSAELHDLAAFAIRSGAPDVRTITEMAAGTNLTSVQVADLARLSVESGSPEVVGETLTGLKRIAQSVKEQSLAVAFAWLADQEPPLTLFRLAQHAVVFDDLAYLRMIVPHLARRNRWADIEMLRQIAAVSRHTESVELLRTFGPDR
ncbi:hypothetical protein [Amycolatopsis sp. Hca4]|uniref:hypothetical protein n=1 Tax=Amycolatopsis sp. Hca4 TaxID=2742131 RepID=UPI0015924F95|nr:hypothetical protein [Amycolatopsis sp. Hca4]QKV73220.1 hypothetical protein HUT10_04965 [Amycolatopsis sp. Hca4]